MAKLDHTLKASTLMESLIAMVILVVCLGIGTMIFTNVLNSDLERKQLHAALIANREAIAIKAEKNYLDAEWQVDDWTVKKTVEKYGETENLYLLSIVILDRDQKIIFIRRELIIEE